MIATRAAASWPTTHGWVLNSKTVYDVKRRGYSSSVTYQYVVSGVTYESGVISLEAFKSTTTKADAEAQKDQFPVGDVLVHFSAKNPAISALLVGESESERFWPTVRSAIACAAVAFLAAILCFTLAILRR